MLTNTGEFESYRLHLNIWSIDELFMCRYLCDKVSYGKKY